MKQIEKGLIFFFLILIIAILPQFGVKTEAEMIFFQEPGDKILIQGNTFFSSSEIFNPRKVVRKVKVIITAYSSSPWETDDDPLITAAGTQVREGVVANNYFPIGTEIRIPEIFGDKIFVIEDRMNRKKGKYQFDIWFADFDQALNFGAKRTYIEVLES